MAIYGLAENIKYYREIREKTQAQIAEAIGVDASTIARYESGERVPSTECLIKMAAYLQIQVDELTRNSSKNKRETNGNGIPVIDFQNGEVVRNSMFSQVGETYAMITPDGLKFSSGSVRHWIETDYVVFVVEEREKLLIVRKSNEDERDAQRWSKTKDGRKYGRKISGRGFADAIYALMKWSKGYSHRVCGYTGVNSQNEEEEILFFELDSAEGYPLSLRARTKAGVSEEQLDTSELERLNYIEEQKTLERSERKEKKEKGIDPGKLKKWVIYPDKWGQYTFGIQVNEYEPRRAICMNSGEEDTDG